MAESDPAAPVPDKYTFRSDGADQVTCMRLTRDILDEPKTEVLFRGTLADAEKWVVELNASVIACRAHEAKKRAERRAALEAEIEERRRELMRLSEIDGVDLPAEVPAEAGAPTAPAPATSPPGQPRAPQPYYEPPAGLRPPGMPANQPDSRPC